MSIVTSVYSLLHTRYRRPASSSFASLAFPLLFFFNLALSFAPGVGIKAPFSYFYPYERRLPPSTLRCLLFWEMHYSLAVMEFLLSLYVECHDVYVLFSYVCSCGL